MTTLPKTLTKCIEFFEKLPGIGSKSAKRLGFYLLRLPQEDLEEFANALIDLKKKSLYCKKCFNLTEDEFCPICENEKRDKKTIAVVETVLDLISMEIGNQYKGLYHVLHGKIDPLNYVGPDEIYIKQLLNRVESDMEIEEIILATNPNVEGEATAMYIKNKLDEIKNHNNLNFRITRIAYGLPMGADLEYADYMTLQKSMENRKTF